VGGIAHDFNNVLAGVLAYGEMLFEETPVDSKLKRYAQNVLTAANRGRELVEQILTYSRTQRGARVPVDIATVVAETLELLRGSLPAGIRLEANAPAAPLVLIGDATQLHQVAMNLCRNAIQAMSTCGTLRVTLEAAELPAQALSHGTLEPGRYVRLTVADGGSGMDENILAHIFEPFFTTKEVGKGAGLGLSLVYAIVAASGGAIDVQSAPQQGSTFTIYLPHSQITLAAPKAAAAGAAYVDLQKDIMAVPCEHSVLPTPALSGLCPLNSAALAEANRLPQQCHVLRDGQRERHSPVSSSVSRRSWSALTTSNKCM
jgi:signal transduction histidine kinase